MICIVLYEKVSKEKSVETLEQGRKNNCWLKLWRYFREHGYTSEQLNIHRKNVLRCKNLENRSILSFPKLNTWYAAAAEGENYL